MRKCSLCKNKTNSHLVITSEKDKYFLYSKTCCAECLLIIEKYNKIIANIEKNFKNV